MLTNISIGSAGIGFNSLWPGDSPLFCSSTVSSVWNSSCFQELMTGRIYSEGWCLACSSLWATVSPSRKLSCSCIRWPLRKTVLEYGCVCLHVFFPQLGETTAQKHQAFFTILVKENQFWSPTLISSFPSLPLAVNVIPPGPWYSILMLKSMILHYYCYPISLFNLLIFVVHILQGMSWVYCLKIHSNYQTIEGKRKSSSFCLRRYVLSGQYFQLTLET